MSITTLTELPPIALSDDGFLHNPLTGEIYGPDVIEAYGDQLEAALGSAPASQRFEVTDRESCEWAMSVRSEIEVEIKALKLRRDAWLKNLDAQIKKAQGKLAWWDYRFYSGVVGFARSLLVGKSKTAQLDNGKVAFRLVRGTAQIIDNEAALAYMEEHAPEKVKKAINKTDVENTIESLCDSPNWFKRNPDGESITLSTGVAD